MRIRQFPGSATFHFVTLAGMSRGDYTIVNETLNIAKNGNISSTGRIHRPSQTQSLIIRLSNSFTFLNILSLQINPVAPQEIAEAA